MRGLALLALGCLGLACSSPAVPIEDTGVAPDAGSTGEGAPAPPVLTPCPDGWREAVHASGGIAICEPYPAAGREDCAMGSMHLPGTPGCRPVGSPCPADGWPVDLPVDATVVYVDAAAAPGGDGLSRATAYATITEALEAAPAGTIIAVAVGVYPEDVYVTTDARIWGACAAQTRISPPENGIVYAEEASMELRDVWVSEAGDVGVETGASVVLEDVVLDVDVVAFADIGEVRIERSAITTAGLYVGVELGTAPTPVEVRDVSLDLVSEIASADFFVDAPGVTSVEGVVIRCALRGEVGIGDGIELGLERSVIQHCNYGFGIGDDAANSRAVLRDVVIEDCESAINQYGGDVVLERVRLARPGFYGVFAGSAGSTLTMDDVLIHDVNDDMSMASSPSAPIAVSGATVVGHRVAVVGARGCGVLSEADASFEDLLVSDVTASCGPDGCTTEIGGFGLCVSGAGRLQATRFATADTTLCGVVVESGEMDLSIGSVTRAPVGACVQVDGFDSARLRDRVRYEDVGVPLQATSYALPDVTF